MSDKIDSCEMTLSRAFSFFCLILYNAWPGDNCRMRRALDCIDFGILISFFFFILFISCNFYVFR